MKIVALFKKESVGSRGYLAVMLGISSSCDVMLLYLIHKTLHNLSAVNFQTMLAFIVILSLYTVTVRKMRKRTIQIIENTAMNLFEQCVAQLRQAKFESFEKIGKAAVYNTISVDTRRISQLSENVPELLDACFISAGALLYLFWLSPTGFFLTIGSLVGSALIFTVVVQRIRTGILASREKEKEMLSAMNHFMFGFKELKMQIEKMDDFLQDELEPSITMCKDIRVNFRNVAANVEILSDLLDFLRFVPLIFILPLLVDASGFLVPKLVTVMLFIPLNNLKRVVPNLFTVNVAVERLTRLGEELERLGSEDIQWPEKAQRRFHTIAYNDMTFAYTDQQGHPLFSIGPLNLTLTAGETIFLIGGNGSGKTTLMKVMVGLYAPSSGNIQIDGREVQIDQHRYLFSTIFTDFHLFDRLYGLENVKKEQVDQLLELMDLTRKVQFEDGQFSTQDLSSGQRKRLALIGSLLEDKPIYLFDEWAAGQDPEFREYFYRELVPRFKREGRTVIAITHDDQFFHLADRIFKMEQGKLFLVSG